MSLSSWSRPLLLTGIVWCCLGDLRAGDQQPDGLPHEQVTLRDGRRLSGYYDPVMAILWLDGPYRARLRLRQGDIIRRSPLSDTPTTTVATAIGNGSGSRQLTIRLREQQVAELDRRRQETAESIRLLGTTLGGLEGLLAGIERTLSEHPEAAADAALMSQQQQVRQQIGELRRRLQGLDEQLTVLGKRRDQAAQVLARARSSQPGVNEPTLPDPMIELRLQALEDEVRALRTDNQDLRRQLERLQPSPTVPVQPPGDAAPTMPPTTVPGSQPATDTTAERVARR